MAAQNSCLEIERKFLVPEDFSQIFQENGFNFVKEFEEVLSDKYFDTQDHHLLHMDYWLRQRNGDWELKYPVGGQNPSDMSTLYHETSNTDDILSKIRIIIPTYVEGFEVFGGADDVTRDHDDLTQMLESGVLKPFAQIDTKRQWFQKVLIVQ